MKKMMFMLALLAAVLVSCGKTERIPPSPGSADEVKKLLAGTTWTGADAGLASGSVRVEIEVLGKKGYTERPEVISWFSEAKEPLQGFEKDAADEMKAHVLTFGKDGTASSTGTKDMEVVGYKVTDEVDDEGRGGMRLLVEVKSDMFKDMPGASGTMTYTYYILGINDQYLYLATPRQINRQVVVQLLQRKAA